MNPWSGIDVRELNATIHEWSIKTFGTLAEKGPTGPLKHLIMEAGEALADPKDILEYADCQLLLWDAARRAGFTYDELLAAVMAKFAMLKHRTYQKTADGEVSEHVKEWPPKAALVVDHGEMDNTKFAVARSGVDYFSDQTVQRKLGWR